MIKKIIGFLLMSPCITILLAGISLPLPYDFTIFKWLLMWWIFTLTIGLGLLGWKLLHDL